MQSSEKKDYLLWAVAFALAAVFIYAGGVKVGDSLEFADTIAGFAILPAVLINLMALALPMFELGCGLLLLVPRTRRIGALAVAVVSIVFFSALLSALMRGLVLDCGCFGVGAPSRPRMWVELGVDSVIFTAALFVYIRLLRREVSEA
jgi:uncharacterized membrane protein YphA (DoxX/SURF4 family)